MATKRISPVGAILERCGSNCSAFEYSDNGGGMDRPYNCEKLGGKEIEISTPYEGEFPVFCPLKTAL